MKIISVTRPKSNDQGIKLYAKVRSRSNPEKIHSVVYIRKPGMQRWICGCEDQLFRCVSSRRNCEHIKAVKKSEGL